MFADLTFGGVRIFCFCGRFGERKDREIKERKEK